MKARSWLAALLTLCSTPALAGPPYLTDDPVPTDLHQWEVMIFTSGEGRRTLLDQDFGLDINFGAASNLQLSATLPVNLSHDRQTGWQTGVGDVEVGAKYQFLDEARDGLTAAVFPHAVLPTGGGRPADRLGLSLPLWLGKRIDGFELFGGGGFALNPGPENKNFWQAGLAVTKEVTKLVTVGTEITRQGADKIGGSAQTRAGFGATVKLTEGSALLLSAGPTWADRRTSYHFYGALGLTF